MAGFTLRKISTEFWDPDRIAFSGKLLHNRKRVQIQGKLAADIYWESGSIAVQLRVGHKVLFGEE